MARAIKRIKGLSIISLHKANQCRTLFGVCLLLISSLAASSERVIVHPSVTQEISTSELRSIFSMRRRTWKDGSAIRVFVLPDEHLTHKSFCKNKLGIFPHRLRKTWDRLVFTGTGQAPAEVQSLKDMRTSVMQTPGAIGYLPGIEKETSQSKEKADEK